MVSLTVAYCRKKSRNFELVLVEFSRVSRVLYVSCAWLSLVAVFKRNGNVAVMLCNTPRVSSSSQCEFAIGVIMQHLSFNYACVTLYVVAFMIWI